MVQSITDDSCGDETFGPVVNSSCYHGLDFTLLFEETFFVIAPCSIFILLAVSRVVQIHSRSRIRKYDAFFLSKLVYLNLCYPHSSSC